jgi:hypothetical protein
MRYRISRTEILSLGVSHAVAFVGTTRVLPFACSVYREAQEIGMKVRDIELVGQPFHCSNIDGTWSRELIPRICRKEVGSNRGHEATYTELPSA